MTNGNGPIVPKTENDLSEIENNENEYDSEDPTWKLPDKKSMKLESLSPQQKRQKIYKCVVPFCQSLGSVGFYKFPQDPDQNEAWMKYCGMIRHGLLDKWTPLLILTFTLWVIHILKLP